MTDGAVTREALRQRASELASAGQRARGASLLVAAGDHAGASELLEQACDFSGAAKEALLAGDPARAALLAALGGDEALAAEALAAITAALPREAALRAAADLAARGFPRQAGGLFASLGAHAAAAEAFAAAHDACRAAESFELAGRPADGARALEAALRRRPDDAAARLALGELLARHGRTEAAVRALQQIPPAAAERARALPLLCSCLTELGLEDAARAVRDELSRLGLPEEKPSPAGAHAARRRDAAPPPAPEAASAREGPVLEGPVLFGRYETVREITATPHARVVEARDRITGERVAVKMFASAALGTGRDALLRFEREARALARLRHPNVVGLRAYHPDGPAMVLSWMAGGSLVERLRGEPVAPARAVEIACALLSALGEAHRLGILHRDVKPSNVLFDEVGTAHLADFGAAHLGDLSTTATAGAIGTFAYMSPEQRMGRPATLTSDLYGVGAVLAELLTGEPPAPAVRGELDPAPSDINPDLTSAHDQVVAALLADDPAARPGDAFEARRALSALSWPERPRPRRSRASARSRSSDAPPPATARLVAALEPGDGRDTAKRWRDLWLDRDVLVLPLDDASLARARAFARAGHAALPTILRVDVAAGEIWVAPPQGRSVADEPRPLAEEHGARLGEALAALHAAGGAHGCVDAQHLYFHDGEITLAYPREAAAGDVEEAAARDRAAAQGLGGQGGGAAARR